MGTVTKQQNNPIIRFRNTDDQNFSDWKCVTLGTLVKRIRDKSKGKSINNVLTISSLMGLVNQLDYYKHSYASTDLSNYTVLRYNDFAYNKSYSSNYPMGAIKRLSKSETGVVSPLYICFRIEDNKLDPHFLELYFETGLFNQQIAKIAQEGARNHGLLNVNADDFFHDTNLYIPEILEQQKIAEFLGSVDSWLENLRQQKTALEAYKRGMMQKIFTQKIRFKDEKGEDFPDWKAVKMSDIGESYGGLSGKSAEDFGKGQPYITYKQIFDKDYIETNKFAHVSISVTERQNRAQRGDILFTTSSETPEEVGYSSVLLDDVNPYINSFSFGFRPKSLKELLPEYARFYFRSAQFRRDVVKLAQGSTRFNLSKVQFMKTSVDLPSFKEQKKIADFLTSIDETITAKAEEITKVEQWKKGLMQKMFV